LTPAAVTAVPTHPPTPARSCLGHAADYCDVSELRQASRERVATFIKHLAEYAQKDRDGLLRQLASYAPKPVSPAVDIKPDTQDEGKGRGAA
jgi:hypothetical protein